MRFNIVRRLVLLIFKGLPYVLGDIGLYNDIFIVRFMFLFLFRRDCVVDVEIPEKRQQSFCIVDVVCLI